MKRYLTVMGFGAFMAASPCTSAAALDDVLTALSATQDAASVRAAIKFERGGVTKSHLMEQIKPDRVHIVLDADGASPQDIVVVGPTTYWRESGVWTSAPSAPVPPMTLSATGLFRSGLNKVTELTPTAVRRIFVGQMAWANGNERSRGQLTVAVSTVSGMIERLSFEGECGGQACRFTESLSYPVLVIQPPS